MNSIYVQNMNKKREDQDHFNVMRKIQQYPQTSQRDLAQQLGFSLGKLNYCLKALQQKGLIKIKILKNKINLIIFMFLLRVDFNKNKLTINFMKRKISTMS